MKNTILAELASLTLVAAPAVANAQPAANQTPPPPNSGTEATPLTQNLTPFQLVNLAYEGGLQAQGIPSYRQLENAYSQNRVNATTLVDAAVEGRYVPAGTVDDGNYINAVRLQLRSIVSDTNDHRWP
jgi:hypothetical protein